MPSLLFPWSRLSDPVKDVLARDCRHAESAEHRFQSNPDLVQLLELVKVEGSDGSRGVRPRRMLNNDDCPWPVAQ